MNAQSIRIRWRQSALIFPATAPETRRILAFHGGGGVDGTPEMLIPFCTELCQTDPELTIVAAQYRTLNRNRATLRQMFRDAAYALKWTRRTCPAQSRLFVMGASFGGLLALDAVQAAPKAVAGLILLNPVTDIARGGFTNRVIPAEGRPEHSPMQRWAGWQGMASLRSLVIHGSADDVVPMQTSQDFCALWPEGRCQFYDYPGAKHGFFNVPPHRPSVAEKIHDFMALQGPPRDG